MIGTVPMSAAARIYVHFVGFWAFFAKSLCRDPQK